MTQLEFDWDEAERQSDDDERRSVLELWRVDEIYQQAAGELFQRIFEDNRIERKPAGIHAESLATYVCMWANSAPDGGLIAIGVEDGGEITGCTSKSEALVEVERRVRCDLVPDAKIDTKRVQVRTTREQQADYVLLIRVYFREDKVVETNKGEAYVRRVDTRHHLTEAEKHELRRERGQHTFELEPCGLTWPDDFDTAAVDAWVGEVCKAKKCPRSEPNHEYLVRHRLGKIDKGRFVPNNACALLFAKDPQAIVPGCMLRFQRIDGGEIRTGRDRNVVKNEVITGTVPQIILKTKELLETQLRTYSRLGTDGKFYPIPEYPEEAWLEVIVNACVHRSYSLGGSNIFVRMFDDQLVVDSPGGFMPFVTPQNIYEVHNRRNWWLMDAMFYMQYVLCENEGTKRIRRAMVDLGLPEPEFEQKQIDGALVRVTLRNNRNLRARWVDTDVTEVIGEERANKLNDYEKRIINFVAEHGKINTSQAMQLMPKPRWHTAKKVLDKLTGYGILHHFRRFSRDSTAYFVLAEQDSDSTPDPPP